MIEIAPKPFESTSILIGKAYRTVYKAARATLSVHDVLPAQFILLSALWEKDGQSGAELSHILSLDSASMTGLLDRAVLKNFIERRPHNKDRRINLIWLSDKGRALEQEIGPAMKAFDDELAKLLSGDAESFNKNLSQLAEFRDASATANNRSRRKTSSGR